MSDKDNTFNNWVDAGSEIFETVNKALEKGDFSHLSSDIQRTVQNATGKGTNHGSSNYRSNQNYDNYRETNTAGTGSGSNAGNRSARNVYSQQSSWSYTQTHSQSTDGYDRYHGQYSTKTSERLQRNGQTTTNTQTFSGNWNNGNAVNYGGSRNFGAGNRGTQLTPFVQRRVSRSAGIGKIIAGGIGIAAFGVLTLSMLLAAIVDFSAGFLISAIIFGGLTAGFAGMFQRGRKESRLAQRFWQYASVVGNRTYIDVQELADQTGMTKTQTREALREMIKAGYLPQAHMDAQKNTLILTQEVYQQYQEAQKSLRERERAASAEAVKAAKEAEEQKRREASMTEEQKKAYRVIQEGNAYVQKIRDANDAIPDDVMSEKLDRLEEIMRRIFEQVEKDPSSAADLRRLMDYYLPTTDKLLQAYIDLDRQKVTGENIANTKKQIEDVLDTINDAFEKLLDSMFEDLAWDVSSDISVMQTMLKQDGLAGDDIRRQKTKTTGQQSGGDMAAPQKVPADREPVVENPEASDVSSGTVLTFGSSSDEEKQDDRRMRSH